MRQNELLWSAEGDENENTEREMIALYAWNGRNGNRWTHTCIEADLGSYILWRDKLNSIQKHFKQHFPNCFMLILHAASMSIIWATSLNAFGRRFYPKPLMLHSRYTVYQFMHSLEIELMNLVLLAPCTIDWAAGMHWIFVVLRINWTQSLWMKVPTKCINANDKFTFFLAHSCAF